MDADILAMRQIARYLAIGAALAALFAAGAACAQANPPSWTRSAPATDTGYPPGAQPFAASGSGTTSATVTVTQPAAFQNTYVCSITMTESGGSAISAAGTLTHAVGMNTLTFAQLGQVNLSFSPCIVNDGSNMVATTPTSTAATNSAVIVTGFFY